MIKTDSQKSASQTYTLREHEEMSSTTPVILPSHAAEWFSLDSIHDIEKDSIPEFFNGRFPSKTPQIYKEYRNFMVLLYR